MPHPRKQLQKSSIINLQDNWHEQAELDKSKKFISVQYHLKFHAQTVFPTPGSTVAFETRNTFNIMHVSNPNELL